MDTLYLSRKGLEDRWPGQSKKIMNVCRLLDIPAVICEDRPSMMWLGSPGNAGRAMLEDMKTHSAGTVYEDSTVDPEHPCHKCEYSMVLIAEHAFMELWECPQCGYLERVKQ